MSETVDVQQRAARSEGVVGNRLVLLGGLLYLSELVVIGAVGAGAVLTASAPAGEVVPLALAAVGKGGTVICAGIHMTDIPSFPYKLLWGERTLRSVANLTRRDGEAFLRVAAEIKLRTVVREYPLEEANAALDDLRHGRFEGAAVLVPGKKRTE